MSRSTPSITLAASQPHRFPGATRSGWLECAVDPLFELTFASLDHIPLPAANTYGRCRVPSFPAELCGTRLVKKIFCGFSAVFVNLGTSSALSSSTSDRVLVDQR